MGYCTVANVQALLHVDDTFSTATHPTLVEAQQFVDDVAAEMDSKLKALYTVPITDATALLSIVPINAYGAAARASAPVVLTDGIVDISYKEYLERQYNDRMDELLSKEVELEAAAATIQSSLGTSVFTTTTLSQYTTPTD